MTYFAQWRADHYYTNDWTSFDGDEWIDSSGLLVDSAEFREAKIALLGGPRHGVVVA